MVLPKAVGLALVLLFCVLIVLTIGLLCLLVISKIIERPAERRAEELGPKAAAFHGDMISVGPVEMGSGLVGEPKLLQPMPERPATANGVPFLGRQVLIQQDPEEESLKGESILNGELPEPDEQQVNQQLGRLHICLCFRSRDSELLIEVVGADGLLPLSFQGQLPLPYVELVILPDTRNRVQTRVHHRTLTPRWNEVFLFEGFNRAQLRDRYLMLVVRYRAQQGGADTLVGEVLEPLGFLYDRRCGDRPFFLSRYLQPTGTVASMGVVSTEFFQTSE